MPRLSSVAPDEDTLIVPFGAEHLTVAYRPSLITQRLAEQMQASVDNAVILEALSGLLVSWDLEDNNGRPIPVTPDGLKDVPIPVLVRVAQTMVAAAAG
jgi:hypothetical protein